MRGLGSGGPPHSATAAGTGCGKTARHGLAQGQRCGPFGSRVAMLPTSAALDWPRGTAGTPGLAQGDLASPSGLHPGPPPRASTSGLRFAGRVRRGGCPWERQPCTCGTGSGALAGREQGTAWARDVAVALGPRPGHLGPRVPFPGPLVRLLAASARKPFRRRGQGSLRSACSVRTAAASAPAQAPGGGLWPGAGRRPSLSCRPRPHCCVYPSPCL